MLRIKSGLLVSLLVIFVVLLSGCAKVGSQRWCNNLKEKPKADWSMNEAADFAKHCVLK